MIRRAVITCILTTVALSVFPQKQAKLPLMVDTLTSITIASEPDYPPHCFVNEDGEADGFAIDIFLAAADAAGLEVEIKTGVWNVIKNDLAKGRIDALPFVGRTPEREEIFDFTLSYLSLHGAVFTRKRTRDIETLDDLKDKSVVVMKGDNAEEFVRRFNISDHIFTTNTYEEAFRELAKGEYDALITQRITGIELIEELGIRSVRPLPIHLPRFRQDFCFAVREGDQRLLNRLNEGLSIIIANDTYEEIRLKWFGPDVKEVISVKDVLRISLFVLIPLAFLSALLSVIFLRREVRRRTARLSEEINEHKATAESLRKRKILLNEMEKVSKIGGWEYDVETGIITWTEGVYDIYGVSPDDFDPSNYDTDIAFYSDEGRELLDKAFKETVEKGKPYDIEVKFFAYDGSEKWVRTMGQPEVEDGQVKRVYGNIRDISESKEVTRQLRGLTEELEKKVEERTLELKEKVERLDKSQKAMLYMVEDLNSVTADLKEERRKLEESNRELEAFSYSVSHDLRAPLRSINGFSRFLLEDYSGALDDEGKRLLTVIRKNAMKMDQLINDILTLSRISRAELNMAEVDMRAVASSMYHETATDEEKQQFDIEIDKLPKAKCDPSLLKQVWHNLIGNALKYSAVSDVKRIEIKASRNKKEIKYFVKDHGAGFDPKYIDKLFGVFKRLHREDEFEGTGVGLAIVQRIIRRHGGSVGAEGKPGKGATFWFALPCVENNTK